MKLFIIVVCILFFIILANLHIWPQQLKKGIYYESAFEKIYRILTGRIDD